MQVKQCGESEKKRFISFTFRFISHFFSCGNPDFLRSHSNLFATNLVNDLRRALIWLMHLLQTPIKGGFGG